VRHASNTIESWRDNMRVEIENRRRGHCKAAIATMRELTDEIRRDAGQSQNESYQATIDAALTKLHQLRLKSYFDQTATVVSMVVAIF
jgi:hypothetical protein